MLPNNYPTGTYQTGKISLMCGQTSTAAFSICNGFTGGVLLKNTLCVSSFRHSATHNFATVQSRHCASFTVTGMIMQHSETLVWTTNMFPCNSPLRGHTCNLNCTLRTVVHCAHVPNGSSPASCSSRKDVRAGPMTAASRYIIVSFHNSEFPERN